MPTPIRNLADAEGALMEAAALVNLLYFVFEHADSKEDWFAQRDQVGWMLATIERTMRGALDGNERLWKDFHAANANGRTVQ